MNKETQQEVKFKEKEIIKQIDSLRHQLYYLRKDRKKPNYNFFWTMLNIVAYGFLLGTFAGVFSLLGVMFIWEHLNAPLTLIIFPFIITTMIVFYVTFYELSSYLNSKNEETKDTK